MRQRRCIERGDTETVEMHRQKIIKIYRDRGNRETEEMQRQRRYRDR